MDNQQPTLRLAPESLSTKGNQVDALAKTLKIKLDPWQRNVMNDWCGLGADGLWTASTAGLAVSRQNGKSLLLLMRILAGALVFGDSLIVYTAHRSDLVRNFFTTFSNYVNETPALKKRLVKLFSSDGRQFCDLRRPDGGVCRILFSVRTSNFLRGLSTQTIIVDEAQDLSAEMLESMLPAMAAVPNSQLILVGTVPGPDSDGDVFRRYHAQALEGIADLAWSEWSADPGDDIDDPEVWKRVNPAFGIRITEKTIRAERAASSDAGFRRERLSVWDSGSTANEIIPSATWKAQELEVSDALAEIVDLRAIGVDTSPDRSVTSVCISGQNADGDFVVSLVEQFGNPSAAVKFVRDLVVKNEIRAVVVDALAQAGTLTDEFKREGVRLTVTDARGITTAAGQFFDGITDGWLYHIGQVQLTTALAQARKRPVGDAWAFNRKTSESDITPVVGSSLALYGSLASKVKRPGRAALQSSTRSGSSQKMIVLK